MYSRTSSAADQPERHADKKTEPPKQKPETGREGSVDDRRSMPPDSIPNPLPGVDPQQTPGIDHMPAEWDS